MERVYKRLGVSTLVPLRIANLVILLFSLAFIIVFIIIVLVRLFYPFELEWLEGISIDQSRWILDGHFLYTQPSIHFIPMIYGPIYFYVSSFFMHLIGVGFTAARLVSILSTLGCFLLLYLIVLRSSSNKYASLFAVGLYAASFRFAGAWMDLAKVDSLALFLLLAGYWAGQRHPSRAGTISTGALYALAFYTKQNTVIIILVLILLSLLESKGRVWLSLISAFTISVAFYLFFEMMSQGWYSYYTSTSVLQGFTDYSGLGTFPSKFLSVYWPAILMTAFSFVLEWRTMVQQSTAGQQWRANAVLSLILIASAWITFLHRWSYDNDFLPACLGIAILSGLGFAEIIRWLSRDNLHKKVQTLLVLPVMGITILQFGKLSYNPLAQLPTQADRSLWVEFISRLEKLPGQVWVFNHGYVSYLAKKSSYMHSNPYGDATSFANSEKDAARRALVQQLGNEAIHQQEFDWIVAGRPTTTWWLPYYIYTQDLFGNSKVFFSVTGTAQPEVLFRKNPIAHGGRLPLNDPDWNLLFGEGWGDPEEEGRQVIANLSTVQVALEFGHDYKIEIQVQPSCLDIINDGIIMKIAWNQNPLGDYAFTDCSQQFVSVNLPAREVTGQLDRFSFEFENSASKQIDQEKPLLPFNARFTLISFIQGPNQ